MLFAFRRLRFRVAEAYTPSTRHGQTFPTEHLGGLDRTIIRSGREVEIKQVRARRLPARANWVAGNRVAVVESEGFARGEKNPAGRPGASRVFRLEAQPGPTYSFRSIAAMVSSAYHCRPELQAHRMDLWGREVGFEKLREENLSLLGDRAGAARHFRRSWEPFVNPPWS
jgi:hypothetical protein